MLIQRCIGPGDREAVRDRILAVAFVSPYKIEHQIKAGMDAATKLRMTLRAHYRADRLTAFQTRSILALYHLNPNQKSREHSALNFRQFEVLSNAFEMIVVLDEEDEPDRLYYGILDCWSKYEQRFLNGNFAKLSQVTLKAIHPRFNPDLTTSFNEFCK